MAALSQQRPREALLMTVPAGRLTGIACSAPWTGLWPSRLTPAKGLPGLQPQKVQNNHIHNASTCLFAPMRHGSYGFSQVSLPHCKLLLLSLQGATVAAACLSNRA